MVERYTHNVEEEAGRFSKNGHLYKDNKAGYWLAKHSLSMFNNNQLFTCWLNVNSDRITTEIGGVFFIKKSQLISLATAIAKNFRHRAIEDDGQQCFLFYLIFKTFKHEKNTRKSLSKSPDI